jgi:hypothetical protein
VGVQESKASHENTFQASTGVSAKIPMVGKSDVAKLKANQVTKMITVSRKIYSTFTGRIVQVIWQVVLRGLKNENNGAHHREEGEREEGQRNNIFRYLLHTSYFTMCFRLKILFYPHKSPIE